MILKVVNLTSNLSDIGEIKKCRKYKAVVEKLSDSLDSIRVSCIWLFFISVAVALMTIFRNIFIDEGIVWGS